MSVSRLQRCKICALHLYPQFFQSLLLKLQRQVVQMAERERRRCVRSRYSVHRDLRHNHKSTCIQALCTEQPFTQTLAQRGNNLLLHRFTDCGVIFGDGTTGGVLERIFLQINQRVSVTQVVEQLFAAVKGLQSTLRTRRVQQLSLLGRRREMHGKSPRCHGNAASKDLDCFESQALRYIPMLGSQIGQLFFIKLRAKGHGLNATDKVRTLQLRRQC
ncbi:MAG TPA: hypothetical protein VGC62_09660 [Pseudomonas sp.]|uniref:hypothetical protein n=1 Tax=Pseudomonas sp. TaxID=306 RepID=UPI002ED8B811